MRVNRGSHKLKSSDSVPRSLRFVLFDLLNSVRRSIDEYAFHGTRGLRKKLFAIVAELQERSVELEQNKDKDEVKGFFGLLQKIDQVTATAMKVKELGSAISPYVPLLMQAIDRVVTGAV